MKNYLNFKKSTYMLKKEYHATNKLVDGYNKYVPSETNRLAL